MKPKILINKFKRKITQIVAFGFSNANIGNLASGKLYSGAWKNFCNPGLNCYSCPAAALSCPIGAIQATLNSPKFNFSFYAVGLLLAFGVVFGRWICGWLCPFGLVQEFIAKIPTPKFKLPKPFKFIKYLILFIFVFLMSLFIYDVAGNGKPAFCEFLCPAGTLFAAIPLLITHPELFDAAGILFIVKISILIVVIIGCLFFTRFFCKIACPLGAIYAFLNKISFYQLKVDKTKCISCNKCSEVCMMDVNPVKCDNSSECIRCGKCKEVCPAKAISMGFKHHA